MKRYERYLIKETLIGILLALLLVVALDALLAFIAELGDVGRGEYGVGAAMRFIVLTLPHRLLDLLPMAVLLGSLMSLGRLAAGSELIALRSAGVSRASITRALLKLGMVLVVIALLIGEYIVPMSEQQARNGRAVAQSSGALHKSKHGVWVRDGRAFVHIRDFYADGKLGKVTRYEFNKQGQLQSAVSARSAKYNGEEWYLFGVERSLVRESIVVSQSEMAERWSLLLDPELLSVVATGPRFLSAWDLGKYILYLRANGLATQRYELALWNKLISPLSLLVMLFFVVPFVLGPLRDVGAGKRMVMGLLFGLAFYLLNRTYYQMGQLYNFNPLFSALFPSLLVLAVTMVVLKRTR
ncbi:LPS export ABC transporter permease LptG [Solemya pervernicosa gill symbiont]|uniref:LPS export ABC transporter permease LptG n=2 Tax=Gammaproteobacteria incertae sedis TaxID=118884 RepID=A0A1T2L648_9GAMM|nr:LPS export ABC transporter permease LptG [Candidatus Reidiella endopervernicosa]OOZ40532.1 LPS export ABC transporter permease LptG [Solemya pervernicosa gill symbiont]QKQ27519.1 LPS export ABC transporter permease LptG [Candidatus Reidiella endopervernicosa]